MELRDRVVVVTGGASGIGRSLALAAAREGAKGIVVADLDGPGAEHVAGEVEAAGGSAVGVRCDVAVEADVRSIVQLAEERFGPVDAFFANAGILVTGGIDAPDDVWDRAWAVNVKSHIYAARAVVPAMLERGGGYLVHTASAAGLLTQLGAAPYSVTKHAIVSLAEHLAITYHDAGLRVSCLCPQAVATNLGVTSGAVLSGRDPDSSARRAVALDLPAEAEAPGAPAASDRSLAAVAQGLKGTAGADGVVSPDDCAALVVEAMREERFLVLPHPQVATYEQHRAGDRERWLRGMRRAQAQMATAFGRGRGAG